MAIFLSRLNQKAKEENESAKFWQDLGEDPLLFKISSREHVRRVHRNGVDGVQEFVH